MPKNTRPKRTMKPVILVLCEGETEECVNMLKKENPWKDYKKGKLSFEQQEHLWENRTSAGINIAHDQASDKPFSMMKDFSDVLEENL